MLFDSEDDVPKAVSIAAGEFEKTLTAKNKADAKNKAAKAAVIEKMIEHDVGRLPIRGGKEFLVLTEENSVKIEKPPAEKKDASAASGETPF